ncbi:speckle-type POZ protein B-like [Aphidius gifuensis]|uniref:speckle-type POZ protein B-like n=1 Tax=Aphidius gifuensis TaxID=684658 RepID=UPI001CDBFB00|nr:speckle-type POZ protein B-like [Aphidius gifuensis]
MTTNSVDQTYSLCVTKKINTRSLRHDWEIRDFYFIPVGVKLLSSVFSSGSTEIQDIWTLQMDLHPQPDTDDVKILLKLESFNRNSNFLAMYDVSILNYETKQKEYTFFKSPVPVKFSRDYTEVSCSLQRSTLINYLSNDNLLISCKLKISTNEPVANQFVMATINTTKQVLKNDYAKLLKSGEFSDVNIIVKTKSFKASKFMLAVRSPVFRAMFTHKETKENTENEIIIEDIDEDVFEKLLYYIYTGEVKNIQEMTMDLFIAADKYQLDYLKNQCEKALVSSIDIEKAAELYVFADKNNAKDLKHETLMFIKSHLQEVLASETFRKLEKDKGSVLSKILRAFDGSE